MKQKRKKKAYKELRLRPNIADHDLQTKIKQIRRFLEKTLQVRVTVQMKGREVTHKDLAHSLLNKVRDATRDLGRMDSRKDSGRNIQTMISPLARR